MSLSSDKNYNEQMYDIKKSIEENIRKHKVFRFPRDIVLHEILLQHSVLFYTWLLNQHTFFVENQYCDFKIQNRSLESFFQESIKWAVKWAYDFCCEERLYEGRPCFKDISDLLNIAYSYELFFNHWYGMFKKQFDVTVNDKVIKFINKNKYEEYFVGYNHWRLLCREESKVERAEGESTLVKKFNLINENEFTNFFDWDFGDYTWRQLKEFVLVVTRELNKIHADELKIIENTGRAHVSRDKFKKFIIVKSEKEWIMDISKRCSISEDIIEKILKDLTYNDKLENTDISYQFFIPIFGDRLMISSWFVNFNVRPERNLMSLLPKIRKKYFDKVSNDCEELQKQIIKTNIVNDSIIFSTGKTKEQKLRPGMDLLVLDKNTNQLLICELKWNVPASSTKEITELDSKVCKGVEKTKNAREYINKHYSTILEEYFGNEYFGIEPSDYDCVVAVEESIGSGSKCLFNAPVVTVDHLIELLNVSVSHTFNIIRNGLRGYYARDFVSKNAKLRLYGYEINVCCFGSYV